MSAEAEIPKPIGHFIIENAQGRQLQDGVYYHYSTVCALMRTYADYKLSKKLEALTDERMRELNPWRERTDYSGICKETGFDEGAKAILKELKK